jgi:hypothetical protein
MIHPYGNTQPCHFLTVFGWIFMQHVHVYANIAHGNTLLFLVYATRQHVLTAAQVLYLVGRCSGHCQVTWVRAVVGSGTSKGARDGRDRSNSGGFAKALSETEGAVRLGPYVAGIALTRYACRAWCA